MPRSCFAAIGFMFGLGSPSGIIPDYAGVLAKKHNFAPHAMEFLALAGKSAFTDLAGWVRLLPAGRCALNEAEEFEVGLQEVRLLGRTIKVEIKGAFRP